MIINSTLSFTLDNRFLFTEQILLTFDIPILFICRDSNDQRYTVLCIDSQELNYIIVESDTLDILKMLQGKIKMIDVFLKKDKCFFVTAGEDYNSDTVELKLTDELQSIDLPREDAYFELETEEICEYIILLLNELGFNNK